MQANVNGKDNTKQSQKDSWFKDIPLEIRKKKSELYRKKNPHLISVSIEHVDDITMPKKLIYVNQNLQFIQIIRLITTQLKKKSEKKMHEESLTLKIQSIMPKVNQRLQNYKHMIGQDGFIHIKYMKIASFG